MVICSRFDRNRMGYTVRLLSPYLSTEDFASFPELEGLLGWK